MHHMKSFFLFISLVLFYAAFLLAEPVTDLGLPQDLIYDNKSIDPKVLLNALYDEEKIDFSKPIEDVEEQDGQEKNSQVKVLDRKLTYDQKKVIYEEYF